MIAGRQTVRTEIPAGVKANRQIRERRPVCGRWL